MIIENVRVDWLFIFEPNKNQKYGCTPLLPHGSPQEAQVKDAIEKAIQQGIASGKFTEAHTKSKSFKGCIHNTENDEVESGERPAHYKDHSYINLSNHTQPGIVGPDNKPILDTSPWYSGCYAHLDVNITPFYNSEHNSRGIGAYLNNIMMVRQGERLDGRQSAQDTFSGFEQSGDDSGELQ